MNNLIKKFFFSSVLFLLASCTTEPDDVEPWDAAAVCPAEGTNVYGMPNRGMFTDERDGQVYRYTTIGDQVWMAENLRYDAPYSMCSSDTNYIRQYCELIEHNCKTMQCCQEKMCNNFGRYYSIIQNGEWFGLIDSALTDTICPKGWHIPTKAEWEILMDAMKVSGDNESDVANRIKSSDSDFFAMSKMHYNKSDQTFTGTDDCEFSIIPSGAMNYGGQTTESGAIFLSSSQKNTSSIYTIIVRNYTEFSFQNHKNTIRCIKNTAHPKS